MENRVLIRDRVRYDPDHQNDLNVSVFECLGRFCKYPFEKHLSELTLLSLLAHIL